ncbi:MAG TPA: sigma 54-interacting transcriptional regulator [Verrucomicrobiae bacterium]|nr:sigma 54-interacting transcriptional regulator [Verrucomicrobiae bacterium]
MTNIRALVVYDLGSPLEAVQKLLAERGLSIHLSASWEDAERAVSILDVNYIFADIAMCQGEAWEKFVYRSRIGSAKANLIVFNPRFWQTLQDLLGGRSDAAALNETPVESGVSDVVAKSAKLREALDLAARYARHDVTVLITGDTGTGKEVIARHIVRESARRQAPFVACNINTIPETLVESELFGHVKGAFTGAEKNKKGLIEAAEGGTLFLDEIGDLAPSLQIKLLRFLETREYYRVGESTPTSADVRIIAATNKNLEDAIRDDSFRKDLYYRLNIARIILSPLRERREDVLPLVEHFIRQSAGAAAKTIRGLSSSIKALFLDYPWPGNVRELKNVVESALMVCDGTYLTINDLPMHLQRYATGHRGEIAARAIRTIEDAERQVVEQAMRQADNNRAKAAALLGISQRTLYRKLAKFASDETSAAPDLATAM